MTIKDVNQDGTGLDGLDPVSYYNGAPLRGTKDFRATIDKTTYYFANQVNMETFLEEPGKYLPVGGDYTSEDKLIGDLSAADHRNQKYVGKSTFLRSAGMEDAIVNKRPEVDPDLQEAKDLEMQNLHDDEN